MKKRFTVLLTYVFVSVNALAVFGTNAFAQSKNIQLNQLHPGYNQVAWADLEQLQDFSRIPINTTMYLAATVKNDIHVVHRSLIDHWRKDLMDAGAKKIYWFSRGHWYAPDEYRLITDDSEKTTKLLIARFNSPHLLITPVGEQVSIRPVVDPRGTTVNSVTLFDPQLKQVFFDLGDNSPRGWALFSPSQIFLPTKHGDKAIYNLSDNRDLVNRLRRSNQAISCTESEGKTALRFRLRFQTAADASAALSLLKASAYQHVPELRSELRFAIESRLLVIDLLRPHAAEAVSSLLNRVLRGI